MFAVVLVWAAAGCGSGFVLSVPGAPKDCRRIAAGPAVVSVFEFEASGGLKQRADWTYDATQNVDAAVAARVKRGGGRTFVPADVAHTDVTSDDFRHWASAALQEIAGTIAKTPVLGAPVGGGLAIPAESVDLARRAGGGLRLDPPFRRRLRARRAGRNWIIRATSTRYDAAQTGIACLVDTSDGRVVACGTSTRRFGDLRTGEAARDAVEDVVARICP